LPHYDVCGLGSVTLAVKDNSIDHEKAKYLFEVLSKSQIREFTLVVVASPVDYKGT